MTAEYLHLNCQNLELRVGFKPLLQNVNLKLSPGETLALTGPNGTGKTTLLRSLAGVARPYSGSVWVASESLWPERKVTKEHRVCYLASQPALLLDHSILGNLEFMCNAFGYLPTYAEFERVLNRVGLQGRNLQTARTLSTGQKRRLTLAGVLLIKPMVMLFDEPTNGLDSAGVTLCLEVIQELCESGSAALIASHDSQLIAFCKNKIQIENFLPVQNSSKSKIVKLN